MVKILRFVQLFFLATTMLLLITSCSSSLIIAKKTKDILLSDAQLKKAQIGISIYDPSNKKFVHQHQSEHYFIPASTAKLFTLYAGMKNLGDSVVGIYYKKYNDTLFVWPSGDPTLMLPEFTTQPIHRFLNDDKYKVVIMDRPLQTTAYGKGWTIDDMSENYMPQRSSFPIWGNRFTTEWIKKYNADSTFTYDLAVINSDLPQYSILKKYDTTVGKSSIVRSMGSNNFEAIFNGKENNIKLTVPFETFGNKTAFHILKNSLYHSPIFIDDSSFEKKEFLPLYSQSADTLFKMMMHQSDNFIAEQILLMVADRALNEMSDDKIIDTLLNNELKDLPQKPRWVDGSGLSRYNLFTPNDEVYVLDRMIAEFGTDRLEKIFPTGGYGTLKNMFAEESGKIFAKTGSMGNVYCLSGWFYNKEKKPILFSVMINNYVGSFSMLKKTVAQWVSDIMKKN
jgi:D-alanyl-D-alanine carboxypeptidase/D-alanyl-D-alanine-endopeptidase (penicillin-binding protein 4)